MRLRVPGRCWLTIFLLIALGAWDASGLDMTLARWFGDAQGFAWREQWLLTKVFHSGARWVSWGLAILLILSVWWPRGFMRRLDRLRRVQFALGSLAAVLLVSTMKGLSSTSCPWDLSAFGGAAQYVSHWTWARDGGGGHCFPAGHASSGFAFIGGYLAFREVSPTIARRWLVAALAAGFVLGFAQQMRGAHFMSHTLWTAWLCWFVALVFDSLRVALAPQRKRSLADEFA